MIDDLATRSALMVAALLLLSTGIAVVGLFGGDSAQAEAEQLAGHLAHQLDAISSIDAEGLFRSEDPALGLPPTLAGSSYRLEFRATDVRVIADTVMAVAPLRSPILPTTPDRAAYAAEDLVVGGDSIVTVVPGGAFVVERTWRWVSAEPAYLTFVYLPQ